MKILAVDPGEKRIGLAISDESGTIANPLYVFSHTSRLVDAAQVAERASTHDVQKIIVGQSFREDGTPNKAGVMAASRKSMIFFMTKAETQYAHQDRIAKELSRLIRRGDRSAFFGRHPW